MKKPYQKLLLRAAMATLLVSTAIFTDADQAESDTITRRALTRRYPEIGTLKFVITEDESSPLRLVLVTIIAAKPRRFIQRISHPCGGYIGAMHLEFHDYNFDGNLDLEFLCNSGASGTIQVWTYDPEKSKFISNKSMIFSNPKIDHKNKIIISESHCCAMMDQSREYLRYEEKRFVVFKSDHRRCWFNNDQKDYVWRYTREEMKNGELQIIRDYCYLEPTENAPSQKIRFVNCPKELK